MAYQIRKPRERLRQHKRSRPQHLAPTEAVDGYRHGIRHAQRDHGGGDDGVECTSSCELHALTLYWGMGMGIPARAEEDTTEDDDERRRQNQGIQR